MVERKPILTFFTHAILLVGVAIVIALTVIQFRFVEKKVSYQ